MGLNRLNVKESLYRPQLDGLRAVAVLGVIFQHFAPLRWSRMVPWGGLGVTLFFVLSGYLITGILLRGRTEQGGEGHFLSRFYIRRSLRIFPVYYAVLMVAALLAIPPVRQTFWWHAAFLSNVYFALKNTYGGALSPLWSLAVEQHFYLIWPWVVLFVPRERLRTVFFGSILLGMAFHVMTHARHWNAIAVNELTPAAFEPFGIGALLSWMEWKREEAPKRLTPFLIAGMVFLPAALWLARYKPDSSARLIINSLAWGPIFFWLVAGAARGFTGPGGRLLQASATVYVGRISYGIYLMHNLVFSKIPERWDGIFVGLRGIAALSVTVALAACSYEWFESPVRRLNRFFPYKD